MWVAVGPFLQIFDNVILTLLSVGIAIESRVRVWVGGGEILYVGECVFTSKAVNPELAMRS